VTGTATKTGVVLVVAATLPALLGSLCEGDGSAQPPVIRQEPVDPRCAGLAGPYPSGFDWLPGSQSEAVVMQFAPAALLAFDVAASPPRLVSPSAIPPLPPDSDGDGFVDIDRYRAVGLCPSINPDCETSPRVGSLRAAFDDLVFVSSSGYEQILFYAPRTGALVPLQVTNPGDSGGHRAADFPLLPPADQTVYRTGLSTKRCVFPPDPVDSLGDDIDPDPLCDPLQPSYFTKFTAASAVMGDRLFVATSNLKSPSVARFQPGTVLVFDFDESAVPPHVQPHVAQPLIFTTAFNPVGLTPYVTASGTPLLLVTQTGGISGAGELLTGGAVDVIDPVGLRVVATIPLGLSGPTFGPIAIDPTGRLGLLGAESLRQLHAIDLAALDDPGLLAPRPDPIVLDGSTPGFGDARLYWSGSPLLLPSRPDGPPALLCKTRTNVAINTAGSWAFASDWCDGTITLLKLDLEDAAEVPLSRDRISVEEQLDVLSPKDPAIFGALTAPSMISVRPGRPQDYTGPDVFFIANEPEGQLCGVRIEY
jgi:hypothetical protein